MLISPAYAQAMPAPGGDLFVSLLPLVLIFVVFYFLLIRPQQQKVKQHRSMVEALKKGDQVVTAGGIFGKVTRVEGESGTLSVEIAPNVQVKVARSTITEVIGKPVPTAPGATSNDNVQPAGIGGLLSRFFKK